MSDIDRIQKVEIDFWKTSELESPESDSIYNILNKLSNGLVFLSCLERHKEKILPAGNTLELGAGQGWASCIFKKNYPSARVTTTDISSYAIQSLPKWERLFDVKIDNSYACTSYKTNESNNSIDQVFCFEAAHHFRLHSETLSEIKRILKPGGIALYLHEPVAPKLLYPIAYWRVNRKRPEVPEDVLIISELKSISKTVGLEFFVDFYPSLIRRGPIETIYYYALNKLPFLQKILPSSAIIIFKKPI